MPVADHPVHELTRKTNPLASCHNRPPMSEGYFVTVKEVVDGQYTGKWERQYIAHAMTTTCQQNVVWPECSGCTHQHIP